MLNNVNLAGLLKNLGYDPEAAINTALGNALTQALTGVTVDLGSVPVLGPILTKAGITNAAAILKLLGFNLLDPFNLSGAATPGLVDHHRGPAVQPVEVLASTLAGRCGFLNLVADEINGIAYLGINALAVLQAIPTDNWNITERGTLESIIGIVSNLPGPTWSLVDVRVPVVVGFWTRCVRRGHGVPAGRRGSGESTRWGQQRGRRLHCSAASPCC